MSVFRIRPLPKGKQIGRKYRKPKLYKEKIEHKEYSDKEKISMLRDSIKQATLQKNRLLAMGGRINEADELGFQIEKMEAEKKELLEKIHANKSPC